MSKRPRSDIQQSQRELRGALRDKNDFREQNKDLQKKIDHLSREVNSLRDLVERHNEKEIHGRTTYIRPVGGRKAPSVFSGCPNCACALYTSVWFDRNKKECLYCGTIYSKVKT